MSDPLQAAQDKAARFAKALDTIAQQMCLCDELNEYADSDDGEDEACPSCYANQVLDEELNRKS